MNERSISVYNINIYNFEFAYIRRLVSMTRHDSQYNRTYKI